MDLDRLVKLHQTALANARLGASVNGEAAYLELADFYARQIERKRGFRAGGLP